MIKETFTALMFAIFLISIFILGWFGHIAYREQMTIPRVYNGLYIRDKVHCDAKDVASGYEVSGDWVCVNVRGMDYLDAVETCQHEAGHEIFAEILEDSPEKIKEVMQILGRYGNVTNG